MSYAQCNLLEEIFVDNFAGGGGASVGIELATGKPVAIAVNHDPDAIAMHSKNHPYTHHYQESVWNIDPVDVCAGRKVALAWFSPDCKHFSKAKGGTPVNKQIRGLAWIVLRWAGTVRPKVIILENVEEFQTWGPVRRGRPVKSKKGQTFMKWVSQLEKLGYKIEWRELRACDYGTPTIRKRFYLVARCDSKPIVFPTPTHGDPKRREVQEGTLLPWRTAAECIDFTLPCPSIFSRKKPLANNTLQRVARGLDKFVVKNPQPFIVQVNHSGGFRGQSTDEPLQTVTAKHGYGVVTPQLSPYVTYNNANNVPGGVDEPLRTITTGNRCLLTTPIMTAIGQTGGGDRSYFPSEPLRTIVSKAEQCIVAPVMTPIGYGERDGQYTRATSIEQPLGTIVAANKFFVSAAHLLEYYGNGQDGLSMDDPLHTITSKDREAVVTSHLCVLRNNMDGKDVREPIPTITAAGGHIAEVRTIITKMHPDIDLQYWPEVRQLLNQHCEYQLAEDEVLLFSFGGCLWYISNIGLRMLEPRELATANGFLPDYKLNFVYNGRPYSKSAQVARIGNSVCPPVAEALVRANLPEYCVKKIGSIEELINRMAV
ncbi:MAG: DNA cytosine methyltransferase [Angelakisella sp.]